MNKSRADEMTLWKWELIINCKMCFIFWKPRCVLHCSSIWAAKVKADTASTGALEGQQGGPVMTGGKYKLFVMLMLRLIVDYYKLFDADAVADDSGLL